MLESRDFYSLQIQPSPLPNSSVIKATQVFVDLPIAVPTNLTRDGNYFQTLPDSHLLLGVDSVFFISSFMEGH